MKPTEEHSGGPRFAVALRETLRAGYGVSDLRADLLAGITVGIVAVPLAMALAIGSGVPPQYGLYTAVIAGLLIALTGGARFSVSGPTAAFIVILHPIAEQYGMGGLVLASLMAGVMLLGMGIGRMGKLIQFIPYPVTTGFTAGIGVVIASLQFKDFFGLSFAHAPESFFERMHQVGLALPGLNPADLLVGAVTLAVLILWPKLRTPIPQHLVALAVGTLLAYGLERLFHVEVATIASRFSYTLDGETLHGIPALLPQFVLPWNLPGADGAPLGLTLATVKSLVGPAMAIALLGAIESLLCAVVADGMAGTHHDPNQELIGQGLANVAAPLFGGFAATGAIARTATNIRNGATSPLGGMVHSAVLLAIVLLMAPLAAYIPLCALSAILFVVAWNMSEIHHFLHLLRTAPRADMAILLITFSLTVLADLVIAVNVGVVLASLLFMHRMSQAVEVQDESGLHEGLAQPAGRRTLIYGIDGPFFFGAAEKLQTTLASINDQVDTVVLRMGRVPFMDATGLDALGELIDDFLHAGAKVVLCEVRPNVLTKLERAGIVEKIGRERIYADVAAWRAAFTPSAGA